MDNQLYCVVDTSTNHVLTTGTIFECWAFEDDLYCWNPRFTENYLMTVSVNDFRNLRKFK